MSAVAALDGAHGASGRKKIAGARCRVTLSRLAQHLPSDIVTRFAYLGLQEQQPPGPVPLVQPLSRPILRSLAAAMPPPPPHDPEPEWPIPEFHLRIEDIAHPGAKLFLDLVRPDVALREAVVTVCNWLYTPDTVPKK